MAKVLKKKSTSKSSVSSSKKVKKAKTKKSTVKKATKKVTAKAKPKEMSLLDMIESQIKKDHGSESVLRLTDSNVKNVEVAFKTGVKKLDDTIGIGGFPNNRIIEIYGLESSGKTTLTLHAIAECQRVGGVATFIDAEHALDPKYARDLGVKLDDLLISQPSSGEEALDIVETCVASSKAKKGKAKNLIIVDSVAALIPKAELEGEVGDPTVGLQARMMSSALRRLCTLIADSNCVVIFINQTRAKISFGYGPKTTTTGGNALKFYASVRIEIIRTGRDEQSSKIVGAKTKVRIVKNKVAPPFEEFESIIRFGVGFDEMRDTYEELCKLPSVDKPKKQAWVTLPNGSKFCGYRGFRDYYSTDDGKLFVDELMQ